MNSSMYAHIAHCIYLWINLLWVPGAVQYFFALFSIILFAWLLISLTPSVYTDTPCKVIATIVHYISILNHTGLQFTHPDLVLISSFTGLRLLSMVMLDALRALMQCGSLSHIVYLLSASSVCLLGGILSLFFSSLLIVAYPWLMCVVVPDLHVLGTLLCCTVLLAWIHPPAIQLLSLFVHMDTAQ